MESLSGNPMLPAINAITDASTRNLVLGYHNAKVILSFKAEEARKQKGKPQEGNANSQLAEAQRYLDNLDRQLTLLEANGGVLGVAVHGVAVAQDEAGRGWLATAFNRMDSMWKLAQEQALSTAKQSKES
ncbi:MAG: hypothetical protein K2W94_09280 [Alphaproteobacteria bacterium]|nr:hypothetical protein [Alphaproteobacteria bacterium]